MSFLRSVRSVCASRVPLCTVPSLIVVDDLIHRPTRALSISGLSEVVGGLGIEKLNSLMPDIVSSAEKPDIQPHVRDGYLMMYIYLPSGSGSGVMEFICVISQA